jgi:hypothetical protein
VYCTGDEIFYCNNAALAPRRFGEPIRPDYLEYKTLLNHPSRLCYSRRVCNSPCDSCRYPQSSVWTSNYNLSYADDGYTLREAVRLLRHLPLTAELCEKHQYLNLGYMVAHYITETLGRTYQ